MRSCSIICKRWMASDNVSTTIPSYSSPGIVHGKRRAWILTGRRDNTCLSPTLGETSSSVPGTQKIVFRLSQGADVIRIRTPIRRVIQQRPETHEQGGRIRFRRRWTSAKPSVVHNVPP